MTKRGSSPALAPVLPGTYWVFGQTGDRSLPPWLHSGWHRVDVRPITRSSVSVAKPGNAKGRRTSRLAFEAWRPQLDVGQTFAQLNAQLKGTPDGTQNSPPPTFCLVP